MLDFRRVGWSPQRDLSRTKAQLNVRIELDSKDFSERLAKTIS